MKKHKKPTIKPIKKLKLETDRIFSKYIRKRDKHICFTCGQQLEENESQCGHYIPRNHLSLRYDEKNNHCQCVGCNIFKKGNLTEYALRLTRKYGEQILEELNKQKNQEVKLSREDYQELIIKYTKLCLP